MSLLGELRVPRLVEGRERFLPSLLEIPHRRYVFGVRLDISVDLVQIIGNPIVLGGGLLIGLFEGLVECLGFPAGGCFDPGRRILGRRRIGIAWGTAGSGMARVCARGSLRRAGKGPRRGRRLRRRRIRMAVLRLIRVPRLVEGRERFLPSLL
ncbi:hypothetical protein ACFVAV_19740, partial [Nocardia sp. NPDC057663]|uniref:hypothetical protein n=1 Tax=Nocardia sp. NPDC057663 TaxID=3346201 RepID=UPI00366D1E73